MNKRYNSLIITIEEILENDIKDQIILNVTKNNYIVTCECVIITYNAFCKIHKKIDIKLYTMNNLNTLYSFINDIINNLKYRLIRINVYFNEKKNKNWVFIPKKYNKKIKYIVNFIELNFNPSFNKKKKIHISDVYMLKEKKDDIYNNSKNNSDVCDNLKNDLKNDLKNNSKNDLRNNLKNNLKNNLRNDLNNNLKNNSRKSDDLKNNLKNDLKNNLKNDLNNNLKNNSRKSDDLKNNLKNSSDVCDNSKNNSENGDDLKYEKLDNQRESKLYNEDDILILIKDNYNLLKNEKEKNLKIFEKCINEISNKEDKFMEMIKKKKELLVLETEQYKKEKEIFIIEKERLNKNLKKFEKDKKEFERFKRREIKELIKKERMITENCRRMLNIEKLGNQNIEKQREIIKEILTIHI
jgi:hypothetical protein